ncbi:hypothetical protein HCC61_01050 [Streptomyces sp. HNM0575]|uniref:hypothetical protein n=1 Tax=Streptomyces sp. HNM0575 TaxID=2716338 RepID=UPI00145CF571|nr:hypothetical protein [Streptomyces sp. HNM0575]NLU71300.1 hypothetical protein [Streptomyces sp. HNM0575]
MPTTCPRCGSLSPETSESCRECGRDLYRVSYPAPPAFRLNFRIGRVRVPARLTLSAALLVACAGISTGFLLQGGSDDEGPVSQNRPSATPIPHEPLPPLPPPSSPEPSKTKAPPKPAPATTPPPSTPSPEPSPTESTEAPLPGIPEAERALRFADEIQRQWGYDPRYQEAPGGPGGWSR